MTDSYDLLTSASPEPRPELDILDTWQRAIGADPSHPYLTRYGLPRQSLRQIDDYLVAPLTDRRGLLIGLRLVDADGVEDIYPASAAKACFAMQRDGATRTIIVQGSVADAVAIHASVAARVFQVPTTRDAMQLHEQLMAEKLGYPVRVAFSSQASAAASCAVGERNPSFVVPPPNRTWAGLYALQGAAGVASWIDDPALIFGGVTPPKHVVVRASGLWAVSDDLRLTRLAGAILAIALAHDEGKRHWQRVLYFRDRDGNDRTLFVPEQQLCQTPNKVVGVLISAGFEFASGDPSLVVQHLVQTSVKRRLIVVERPGWHGEHYVTPCGTIGRRSIYLPVQAGSVGAAPLLPPDRLELWQKSVARYAEGNSRLVASLAIALGGIAIGLFDGQLGIGLHLRGLSSLGKTTALRVAASVYGSAQREVGSWSATDSGLETLAVHHHHRALILDELAQIRPEAAVQAAYLLANGSGRQRANGVGRHIPSAQWQLTFLSSGEISLEDKVSERSGAPQMCEGQAVRLIDLLADAGRGHGIYETLHGHADGAALSDALNRATEGSTGDVAVKFVQAIADDVEQARDFLVIGRENFVRDHVPGEADCIVRRVYSNFGFLAAATELAIRTGILPWSPGSGHAGINICAQAWLSAWQLRSRPDDPLEVARAWLASHIASLTPWELAARSDNDCGYYCQVRDMVYLKATGWRRLCGKLSSAHMQEALRGANVFRYTNARPPGGRSEKFYTIAGDAVESVNSERDRAK